MVPWNRSAWVHEQRNAAGGRGTGGQGNALVEMGSASVEYNIVIAGNCASVAVLRFPIDFFFLATDQHDIRSVFFV